MMKKFISTQVPCVNHLLYAITTIMLICACSKDNTAFFMNGKEKICFGKTSFNVNTKAVTETTADILKTNGFYVSAVKDNNSDIYFKENRFSWNGTCFSTAEPIYYPEGTSLSFYATYPYATFDKSTGSPSVFYNGTNQDLVIAKAENVSNRNTPIDLQFIHCLSQLSIKCKTEADDAEYNLKSIQIKAKKSGYYRLADNNWNTLADTVKTIYSHGSGDGMTITETASAVGENFTEIPEECTLLVSWVCKSATEETIEHEGTIKFTPIKGKNTTLNISLNNWGAKVLKFTTTVSEWKVTSVSGENDPDYTGDEKNNTDLLPGVFTVNEEGKKVRFTKGSLYWNGSKFCLEEHQYDFPNTIDANHIGHFYFSTTLEGMLSSETHGPEIGANEIIYAADGRAIDCYTLLTLEEWDYVIAHHLYEDAYYNPENQHWYSEMGLQYISENEETPEKERIYGIILIPDNFTGTIKRGYTRTEWITAEKSGLVFMPTSGYIENNEWKTVGNGYVITKKSPAWGNDIGTLYYNSVRWLEKKYEENGKSGYIIGYTNNTMKLPIRLVRVIQN